tara:strand:- start:1683 stop:2552 length:870 start_codon:yes stop_codon:yes gene_type:complete
MSIKQNGGVFGRNPTFNDVTIEGELTFDGDIDINSDLKISQDFEVVGDSGFGAAPNSSYRINALDTSSVVMAVTRDGTDGDAIQIFNGAAFGTRCLGFGVNGSHGTINNQYGNIEVTTSSTLIGKFTANGFAPENGKGIDFSATAGTGTSELFDDYEEGTWQPVYTSTTNAANNVNNSRVGYYTKVGNVVYATAYLVGNDLSGITSTDPVRIGGLPFASSSTSAGNDQAVNVAQYRYLLTTDHTFLVPNASSYVGVTTDGFSGATYATLFQYPSSTGTSLKISMVYQAQ